MRRNSFCAPNLIIDNVANDDRALEYIGVAVEDGGGLLYSHFIAFKIYLEKVFSTNA